MSRGVEVLCCSLRTVAFEVRLPLMDVHTWLAATNFQLLFKRSHTRGKIWSPSLTPSDPPGKKSLVELIGQKAQEILTSLTIVRR